MTKLATLFVALGVFAFAFVTLAPSSADAGWRRKAWRHGWVPGATVYVDPRWGYYAPRRYYRRYGSGCCYSYPYAYYPYWRGRYWRGWY